MRARRHEKSTPVEVMLSPLIDCVFLLLVFFLVTSMFKRFERQIPVRLTDATTAIAPERIDTTIHLGVDEQGGLYQPDGTSHHGAMAFAAVPDADAFFNRLANQSTPDRPVELVVVRETPFQEVIRVLDRLELLGFEKVSSRIRDGDL